MPSSANPGRVLLIGTDRTLLDTRALVLKSARLAVDITTDLEAFKKRIADPQAPYGAVICCYTVPKVEREEVAAIAARSQTPVLHLDCLVKPTSLIAQVTALLPRKPVVLMCGRYFKRSDKQWIARKSEMVVRAFNLER